MSDEFDIFDATPVTSADEEPITGNVEREGPRTATVNGREGLAGGVGGADIEQDLTAEHASQKRQERQERLRARYEVQCIHCRHLFESGHEALAHECPAEPLSSCRFCGEEQTRRDDPEHHLYSCREFRRYHEQEIRQARAEIYRGNGLSSFDHFEYIRPWYHEFAAHLHYDCREKRNPLLSYYALNSLQKEHDWDEYGALRTTFEIDRAELPQVTCRQLRETTEFGEAENVEKWAVEFTFHPSGIDAPNGDIAADLDWRLAIDRHPVFVRLAGRLQMLRPQSQQQSRGV